MNGPRHLSRRPFFVTEAQRTTAHRSSCDSNGKPGGPWNADETACCRCEGCDSPLNKLRVGAAITPEQAVHSNSTVQNIPTRYAGRSLAAQEGRLGLSSVRDGEHTSPTRVKSPEFVGGPAANRNGPESFSLRSCGSKPPDATGPLVPSGPACQINLAWLFDHANSTSCSVT